MKVVITGGFGFLGRQLCQRILALGELVDAEERKQAVTEIVLCDLATPPGDLPKDPRVRAVSGDICSPATCSKLICADGMIVFHLASIMSGQGEKDFDLCMRVNLHGTLNLLEACRAREGCKFIFPSSGACFGERGEGPETDTSKLLPYTTYGMTKVCVELLLNDYSRRGFLDGRAARLPTVIPRPEVNSGLPAAFSAVIREPLKGIDVTLPVDPDMPHAVCGFRPLVRNLIHLAELPQAVFANSVDRTMNMPALNTTLRQLHSALLQVVRDPDKLGKVSYEVDEALCNKLRTFHRNMDASRARSLGFFGDTSPADIAADFAAEYLDPSLLKPVLEIAEEPRHNLMLSNDFVRVFRTEFPVGESTLWHAHRVDSLYFFFHSLVVLNERQGQPPLEDTLSAGEVRYGDHCSCPLVHRITAKGPASMFCLDVELAGFTARAHEPAQKRPRVDGAEAQLPPGLQLAKERPGARVWALKVDAGGSWSGAVPFRRMLWIAQKGAKVRGSLGSRLLLPADVGYLEGAVDLQLEVLGQEELGLWIVELR